MIASQEIKSRIFTTPLNTTSTCVCLSVCVSECVCVCVCFTHTCIKWENGPKTMGCIVTVTGLLWKREVMRRVVQTMVSDLDVYVCLVDCLKHDSATTTSVTNGATGCAHTPVWNPTAVRYVESYLHNWAAKTDIQLDVLVPQQLSKKTVIPMCNDISRNTNVKGYTRML